MLLLCNHNSAANEIALLYMKEIHVLKDNRLLKLVGRLDATRNRKQNNEILNSEV